ncbi:hypothetical protein GGX14DRAFT_579183 [Mycena pura]|uniref:F-box domain-containing protein n=1 Tax=Mycena pura TaxID=153505 RepID=A0AAD6UNP1_9AGAR|nr:hypothetical protein GGX14DRAFT_579183 [Mycena pura]
MPELAGFPSLTCFRVFFVTWMDLLATSITSFLTVCHDITKLDIQHATFQTPHQVIALLARLPRLEKVIVHSKMISEYSYQTWTLPELLGPPIPPRNLQIIRLHLKFRNYCWPSIFSWIVEGQSTVRMLGLGLLWGEDLPAIGTRLGTLAPVLCDLDLALMSKITAHQVETHLAPYLARLTRVTHLTLRIGCRGSMPVHWYASLALLTALPRSPAALKTLTIFLAFDWTHLQRLDWAHLYAAVRMHTRLRFLQFRVDGRPLKSERAMEVIWKHVAPEIAARSRFLVYFVAELRILDAAYLEAALASFVYSPRARTTA